MVTRILTSDTSRTSVAYEHIKRRIIRLEIRPGGTFTEAQVAAELAAWTALPARPGAIDIGPARARLREQIADPAGGQHDARGMTQIVTDVRAGLPAHDGAQEK